MLALLGLLLAFQVPDSPVFRRRVIAAALWFFLTITTLFVLNLWFLIFNLRYRLPIIAGMAVLVGLLAFVTVVGIASHADGFLPARAPYRELQQTAAARYLPGDHIWYNMDAGALGCHLLEEGWRP